MTRPVQMWVDPSFAKKLKLKAVEEDMSVIKFTGRLAREEENSKESQPTIKRRFNFGF